VYQAQIMAGCGHKAAFALVGSVGDPASLISEIPGAGELTVRLLELPVGFGDFLGALVDLRFHTLGLRA
jgi:hypothetical protein